MGKNHGSSSNVLVDERRRPPARSQNATLTAVPGLKVGHFTLSQRPTGCTVILAESGAIGGVDVRGSAPGTRETDLLSPVNTVERVHAIVLAGGSAFGLDAASGVMRYLDERGIGFKVVSHGIPVTVPIVPAAVLIDLGVGGNPKVRPDAQCGYQAAVAATDAPVTEGSVGAGAGATVGKLAGYQRAMKGGLGTAALHMPDGLVVAAIVAVNALGDVIDPDTGAVVAGVRTPDGRGLADARVLLHDERTAPGPRWRQHDNWGRSHQSGTHENPGHQDRADGAGRARPRDLSRAHAG